ncbi:MAG TPA: branched-chain amino acid ABC transporter permease [Ktedonobacterales bacterium]|nr:branched-chain amino acid ABC transporter permease [Ktedonobacterales bacterium]
MATQTTPKQATPSRVDRMRSWASETMIAGRPVIWYVTGWRFALIALILTILLPLVPYDVYPGIQSLVVAMTTVWIYVMLALGLNIVVGYAGLLDLGYVAFFVIGSYTFAAGTFGQLHDWTGGGVFPVPTFPMIWLIPIGALLAGFFGILLGAPTLRLRGDYLAIVTLGFGEIVPIVFQNLPTFFGNLGMSATQPAPIDTPFGQITFTDPLNNAPFYYLALGLVVLITLGVAALRDSSVGRAWVAIREDETAAETSGVNLTRTKLLAFALGAFVGGIGGVINTAFVPSILPVNFNFNVSITILIMVVLGGIGSIPGVIVGAIILRLFDVYILGLINDPIHQSALVAPATAPLHFLANVDFNVMKYLIYGIVLVIMILLRPQGIIPDARRRRELKGIGAAPEDMSAVGLFEAEEAGADIPALDNLDQTAYAGEGSDAQGRDS